MKEQEIRNFIQESIHAYIREIDKAGNRAAIEAKYNKTMEAIEERKNKINHAETVSEMADLVDSKKVKELKKEIKILERSLNQYKKQLDKMEGKKAPKENIDEFDMNQFSMGGQKDAPKASLEWNMVPGANKEVLAKSTGQEPMLVASDKGSNHLITKGSDNKFYLYTYTQASNPGEPKGPFNSEEEAKKQSINENKLIKQQLNEELRRMQKLAGIQLNENYINDNNVEFRPINKDEFDSLDEFGVIGIFKDNKYPDQNFIASAIYDKEVDFNNNEEAKKTFDELFNDPYSFEELIYDDLYYSYKRISNKGRFTLEKIIPATYA